jgi:hypothetical protein
VGVWRTGSLVQSHRSHHPSKDCSLPPKKSCFSPVTSLPTKVVCPIVTSGVAKAVGHKKRGRIIANTLALKGCIVYTFRPKRHSWSFYVRCADIGVRGLADRSEGNHAALRMTYWTGVNRAKWDKNRQEMEKIMMDCWEHFSERKKRFKAVA